MHGEDKRLVDNVLTSDKIMAIEVMVKMTVELEECPTEYLRYSLRHSSISPVEADTEDYKNFISLDISDFALEKSCLEVFEIRKKSLHLHPQTKKNHEIFNEHNYT